MYNFRPFKDHNSGKKKGNLTNDPIFWFTFWALSVCDIHFCIWKISKFVFMGLPFGPFWSAKYLNLKVKAVRSEFCPVWFRKHKNQRKKSRFYFFNRVENQNWLISWSIFRTWYILTSILNCIITVLWKFRNVQKNCKISQKKIKMGQLKFKVEIRMIPEADLGLLQHPR